VNGKLIGVSQPTGLVGLTGYVSITAPIPQVAKGVDYIVSYDMADVNGNKLARNVTIVGS